jgi:hypothetical protein
MVNLLRRERAIYRITLSRFAPKGAVLPGNHFVAITRLAHNEDSDRSSGSRNILARDQEIERSISGRRNAHFLTAERDLMTRYIEPSVNRRGVPTPIGTLSY